MRRAHTLRLLAGLVAPPRCAACAAPCPAGRVLCAGCTAGLAAANPGRGQIAGLGEIRWAAPYEGVARDLVTALKFRARLALAPVLGAKTAAALGSETAGWTAIAVPAAPLRRRRRGFDPAELLAVAVALELGLGLATPLVRTDGPRQVGRHREERLRSPPRVRATAACPPRALLVDDVLTTGATLRACAGALRDAGCGQIRAAVFARALGGEGDRA